MVLKKANMSKLTSLFLLSLFLFIGPSSFAQLPTCIGPTANYIYYLSGTSIYNFDPTLPVSASNPTVNTIVPLAGANGLSVGRNFNSASPSITFYMVGSNNNYYYYNGTTWVNTGFSTGNTAAVNIGSGGNYIYNIVGFNGEVYSFNGTSNGTLLTTVPGWNAGDSYDISADCSGNFYVIEQNVAPTTVKKFNTAGTLLNTYNMTGYTGTGGGGLAVFNNNIYFDNSNDLYMGTITGSTINFSMVATLPSGSFINDLASCPTGINPQSTGPVYLCPGSLGVELSVVGAAPYTWTVISGPATLTHTATDSTRIVTTNANAIIVAQNGANNSCDTFHIIVPKATVHSGLPGTVSGCNTYIDTLNGLLTDTTTGLTYDLMWSPVANISSGGNTLRPAVHLTGSTVFKLTATTISTQGNCSFSDSGLLNTINTGVIASFTDTLHLGCGQDTVIFTNLSTAQTSQYWDFGDNSGSPLLNPTHIYTNQANHSVLLKVSNGQCTDTMRLAVDPPHLIHASFTVSADTICQDGSITFANTSAGTTPAYLWSFGDGSIDTTLSPAHIYTHEGTFLVTLTEKDFVPCYDTVKKYVTVDSLSTVSFTASDSVLCRGKAVIFTGKYANSGYVGNEWDFGDGAQITNTNPIEHGYLFSGTYHISVTTKYRACPNVTYFKDVTVRDYPMLNLGADTSMCPNANPIQIGDLINAGNPNAAWLWNTGDTTAIINAPQPGVYYATVSVNGCSTSDTVWIKNDCYVSIPNSFTPNSDGINDYFFPRQQLSSSVSTFKMNVYNRWGQIMFETGNISGRGWDGKFNGHDQPEGVYIYTIQVTFTDGESENYKGNVTLLR